MAENKPLFHIAPGQTSESASRPASAADASPDLSADISSSLREVVGSLPAEQKKGGTATAAQQKVVKTPQERKEELLARLPKDPAKAERFLRHDLEKNLEKTLGELEHQLHKNPSYFEMNTLLSRIREFREVLAQLAYYAFEQLKVLWLRFVHNLSI